LPGTYLPSLLAEAFRAVVSIAPAAAHAVTTGRNSSLGLWSYACSQCSDTSPLLIWVDLDLDPLHRTGRAPPAGLPPSHTRLQTLQPRAMLSLACNPIATAVRVACHVSTSCSDSSAITRDTVCLAIVAQRTSGHTEVVSLCILGVHLAVQLEITRKLVLGGKQDQQTALNTAWNAPTCAEICCSSARIRAASCLSRVYLAS